MRLLLMVLATTLVISSCSNNTSSSAGTNHASVIPALDTNELTTIEWETTSKDFGKITEGEKLDVGFKFKNTGNKPLVIYMIKPSCGCTLAEEPAKPVAPGEIGEIKAMFNSQGKVGVQHKSIFIHASTKGTQDHTVFFQVEVLKKDK